MFKYLYGPVFSWRLGVSLGIDLISTKEKVCNFDCSYCQIGKTKELTDERQIFVNTQDIIEEIKNLDKNTKIDFLTFSGRGEPTLALNIGEVIKELKKIRKEKIAVITNSTNFYLEDVRESLKNVDVVMAKFDVWNDFLLKKVNNPIVNKKISFDKIYDGLKKFRSEFSGILELQIMFTEDNKNDYKDSFDLIKNIQPDIIQINTPLRPCDINPLTKEQIDLIKKDFEFFFNKYKISVTGVYDIEKKQINSFDTKNTELRRGKI
jgi:wyosine [tRNA(Phe)-imidazoG37] synthetase (radical SAM superfamily)